MAKKLIFIINKKGEVKEEAVGYNGQGCEDATRAFEEALGGQVTDRIQKNQMPDELVEKQGND